MSGIWQFQEICTYIPLNGHAVIQQQSFDIYDTLADGQKCRDLFIKKHQTRERTSLTEEKIKRLNSIGFPWDARKPKIQRLSQAKRADIV